MKTNLCFFLLFFFYVLSYSAPTIYYIDESTQTDSRNGSWDSPFISLEEAFMHIDSQDFEIVLRGETASLSTSLVVPPQSVCKIKPYVISAGQTHFPLRFEIGAMINGTEATIVVEDIEIIELNPNRDPITAPFAISQGSLTLTRVKAKDIIYDQGVSYSLFSADTSSQMIISECEFENLVNTQIWVLSSEITISNSRFSMINNQDYFDFIFVYTTYGEGLQAIFQNISLEKSNFLRSRFVVFTDSILDITFDGLSVQDVTLTNNFALVGSTFTPDTEIPFTPSSYKLNDITFNNIFEQLDDQNTGEPSTGSGLLFDLSKPTSLTVSGFTAKNVLLEYAMLFYFQFEQTLFLDSRSFLPVANLANINIEDSTNPSFGFSNIENITVQSVKLLGNSANTTNITNPTFWIYNTSKVLIQDVYSKNCNGPVFRLKDVLNQQFLNCQFEDSTTSQLFTVDNQNLVETERTRMSLGIGLNPKEELITIFKDFKINGFTDMNGIDATKKSNDTYLMVIRSEVGKVFIQDSQFSNVEMGGLLSTQMNYLRVENVTYDADPMIPPEQITWHRAFQFVTLKELEVVNSTFINNKNLNLFNLWNIEKNDFFDIVDLCVFTFDNINVISNTATPDDPDSPFDSLFIFHSPLKPVQVTFKNSQFINNKISSGIILAEESERVDIMLSNNVFEGNSGVKIGTVLTSQNMQAELNTVQIVNNIFKNNKCQQNGGVFGFINILIAVEARQNIYIGNSAGLAGGVGYAFLARFSYSEENSTLQDNSAGTDGGAWYLSLANHEGNPESISFADSTFQNSGSSRRGGAIYISSGTLVLQRCDFKENSASLAGGDIYNLALSSIQITGGSFVDSVALQGSLLYTESLQGESVAIQSVHITNKRSISPTSTLIILNLGTFTVQNTLFSSISSALIGSTGTTLILDNISLNDIDCSSNQNPFCILQGIATSLTFSNSIITGVTSNRDLITLESPPASTPTIINNVQIYDLSSSMQISDDSRLQYALRVNQAHNLMIQNSVFHQISGLSFMALQNNAFQIVNTTFSNQIVQGQRLLQGENLGTLPQYARFLVLDSSKGSIVDSTFTMNAQYTDIEGGAIKIQGNKGSYHIARCLFQDNQGSKGGAINVNTGAVDDLYIEDSQFINNKANFAGGAIYFNDQGVLNPVLIIRSTFTENQAKWGGGIYVGYQEALIQNSNFGNNNAAEGGAIASFADNTTKFLLRSNSFMNNNASVGSALRALYLMNFYELSTNIFTNNQAIYGGYLATQPNRLQLKIYEVDEAFLFLDDVSLDYIKLHPDTILVYDSTSNKLNTSLVQKSGRTPNYLYEFMLLDELNQNFPAIRQSQIILKAGDSQEKQAGILGRVGYSFSGGFLASYLIFNSFYVIGHQGTQVTFSAEGTFYNTFLEQYNNLLPTSWTVTLVPCSVGEIYDPVNLICAPCPSGTYSLEDPYTAKTCTPCLGPLKCLGGTINFPISGYWRMTDTSDNLVKCFNSKACLGGETNNGKDISKTGNCAAGYTGVCCGSCVPGYAKFGTGQRCVNCSITSDYYIKFVAYLFIQIAVIILTTRAYLVTTGLNDADSKVSVIRSTLVKIIIDFLHVLNLTAENNFQWPDNVEIFLDTITKITPTNKDAFSTDCFITLIKGNNQSIFFIKLLLFILQPMMFMLISSIFWVLVFKLAKRNIINNPEFKTKIMTTTIIIIYILQPGILKSTLQLFNCRNFGPEGAPKYFLVEDVNIECWGSEHTSWALGLGVPSLILWLVIPSALLIMLTRKKETNLSKEFKQRYNFIFLKYKERRFYWEVIILARKLVLIILAVFLSFAFLQAYLSFVALIVAYVLQAAVKPFSHPDLNKAENLSLFSSAVIIYTGLFFVRADGSETVVPLLLALDTFTGILFFGYCLFVALKMVQEKIIKFRSRIYKKFNLDAAEQTFARKLFKRILGKCEDEKSPLALVVTNSPDTEPPLKDFEIFKLQDICCKGNQDSARKEDNGRPSVETVDTNVRHDSNKKAGSLESLDDSLHNFESRLRYQRSQSGSDETPRIGSIRGSEADLLNSFRVERSVNRMGSKLDDKSFPLASSQTFDGDEERLFKIGSLADIGIKEVLGLDVVEEEPPTATLQKETLREDRYENEEQEIIELDFKVEDEENSKEQEDGEGEHAQVLSLSAVMRGTQDVYENLEDSRTEDKI